MVRISFITWLVLILTCCMTTQACKHAKLSSSNKKFGGLVTGILSKQQENVVFSSISLHEMLSLLYYGSTGTTSSTLQSVLELPDRNETAIGYNSLIDYTKSRMNATIIMANRIYVADSLRLKPEFQADALRYFNTEIRSINFMERSAIYEMNEWVSKATSNMIRDIITPNLIDSSTRLLIVNGLFFSGRWLYRFTVNPGKQIFHRSPMDNVPCQMMSMKGNFEYYSNVNSGYKDAYSYIRIPYKDNTLSLVLVTPASIAGLPDLEQRINSDRSFLDFKKERRDVVVTIPRFKIEHQFSLNAILKRIGLDSIFDRIEIPRIVNAEGDVRINDIVQRTMIEVGDDGTQAAAVSPVSFSSNKTSQGSLTYFTADRPFLFFLEANSEGESYVLLQGKVTTPRY